MENFVFKSNRYLNTVFGRKDDTVRLLQLFGLSMEPDSDLPKRIKGIFDIYTSLGAGSRDLSVKAAALSENSFFYEAELFHGALAYRSLWTYYPELGIIDRKDRIINTGSEAVHIMKAVQKYLFTDNDFTYYSQNTRWCYENVGEWNQVHFGGVSLACEGGRTTQGAVPFLALKGRQDNGAVFHLIPNGNWRMDLRTVSLGVSQAGSYEYLLEIGQNSDHFNLLLKPGEEFEFPGVIIQKLVGGSLPQTAVNLQKYFLLTDTGRFRVEHPVVYNPWFEHYALLNVDRLKQHVQTAKKLGCEIFEIDAGWYGSQAGDWWSQAGDWNEKMDGAFYGNMKEFVDYVKAQGLKFGLWMEPERIGEATPIRKQHPEYFEKGNGFYYPKLYLPEVADYLYKEITGLIEKYGLSWMKMDFNFEFGEDGAASEFYLYYKAWYSLLEMIKSNYPGVFLEACAAGGMRNDLHTTCVYDGHFLSDNVNSWDMQAAYQQCCLRLPHYRLIKWLVVSPGAKISLYDSKEMKKKDSLITTQAPGAGWDEYEGITAEFACQLTMSGPVGLSGNFIEITGEQKQVFKTYIEFYKKYRNFYKNSIVILGDDPKNVGDRGGFYHLQYLNPMTGEQLVFAYRYATSGKAHTIRLKELDENRIYQLFNAVTEEKLGDYTGEYLMYQGLELSFETRHSGKILLFK